MGKKRIVSLLFIILQMGILFSCTAGSTSTTKEEEEVVFDNPLTFDLADSSKEYDLIRDGTSLLIEVISISDHSHLVINYRDQVYKFVSDGEVIWYKDSFVCSGSMCNRFFAIAQVLRDSKEIIMLKYVDTYSGYIIKVDEYGKEVWSVGPFNQLNYFQGIYYFRDVNYDLKSVQLNVSDGSYSIMPIYSLYSKTVGDNIVSVEEDGFDYYLVNQGLDGNVKWRKGPFISLDNKFFVSNDSIFYITNVQENSGRYYKKQLHVIKLDGTELYSSKLYDNIILEGEGSPRLTDNNELFYAYKAVGGSWYLARVDSNLRELWKTDSIYKVNFEIFNNHLFYLAKTNNANELKFIKADIKGNTIFEKVLPKQEYTLRKIDQSGILLIYVIDGKSAIIRLDHQGNEILSLGPDHYYYYCQNNYNDYLIGYYKDTSFYIMLYSSDGTMLWHKLGNNNYPPTIYGLTDSGSVAFSSYINDQEHLSLINKDGEVIFKNQKIIAIENVSDNEMIIFIDDGNNLVKEFKITNSTYSTSIDNFYVYTMG